MVAFVGAGPNGEGIYMVPSAGGRPQKLVGKSGDGILDPGESHDDKNNNGKVDAKEDINGFASLDFDAK